MAGIYIHIPFCKQKCYYCDFHFSTSLKKKDEMLSAIKSELILRKDELKNQLIETIYFGGGTPSLLSIDALQSLIDEVFQNYTVSKNPEITLEANPDDLSDNQIIDLKNTPINRLSIGIQSFFDDDLRSMNRAHNAEEAGRCLEEATKYFDNITIDLIYGIPNMSIEKWDKNIQTAFKYKIPHISAYALTIEPKSALDTFIRRGKYPPIDEALALEHFNHLVKQTESNGFVQYEISNFGQPNYFSRHNASYWQGLYYLGIGPSAHSYNGKQRSWNVANNTKYLKEIQQNRLPQEIEILSDKNRFNEFVMTGLRTIWGISLNQIESEFGLEYKELLLASSEKFRNQDLLILSSELDNKQNQIEKIKTTRKGKFLADGIASEMFMI